jgi:hypothetical protein
MALAARPLFPIPEEPETHLPDSASEAYKQGWREGWIAAWGESHKHRSVAEAIREWDERVERET